MMRFLVLDCEDSKAWKPLSFGDMFALLLSAPTDKVKWDICNIAAGDPLPPTDCYNGVVITGSHYNVSDRSKLPWFDSVCHLIQRASAIGYPRIYGGCFGCQIMAHALGGGIGRNPSSCASPCFILKAETMQLVDPKWTELLPPREEHDPPSCSAAARDSVIENASSICACDATTAAKGCEEISSRDANGLTIIESHGYCVCSLPPDTLLLATSASCNAEMWIAGRRGNLLAVQGHPEFEQQYCVWERIWPAVVGQRKALNETEIAEAKESLCGFSSYHSRWIIRLIRRFLHEHSDYDALAAAVMQREIDESAGGQQSSCGTSAAAVCSATSRTRATPYFVPPGTNDEVMIGITAEEAADLAAAATVVADSSCCAAEKSSKSGNCCSSNGESASHCGSTHCFSVAAGHCCAELPAPPPVNTAAPAPQLMLPLLNKRCPFSNRPVVGDSLCVYTSSVTAAAGGSSSGGSIGSDGGNSEKPRQSFVVGFCNPECRDDFVAAHAAHKGAHATTTNGADTDATEPKYWEARAIFDDLVALRVRAVL